MAEESVFDRAQELARKMKLEHQGAKARPVYRVGQEIECVYVGAPILPETQYDIGQIIDITVGGRLVARYRVEETDDTTIRGVIVEVIDVPPDPRRRHTHEEDTRRKKPM